MKLIAPFLFSVVAALAVEAPVQHPRAARLPCTHQGPFVTAADGSVLCVEARNALRSNDGGYTWTSAPLFADATKFTVSNERALLRTREGVIVAAWMNLAERRQPAGWRWGDASVQWTDFVLPTYTSRSTDDGKTWEPPVKLSDPWCGCIHSLIQMRSGRLVLVGQEIIPQWRHATVMWVSDDLGASWQRGDVLDYGIGAHDHAGSVEGSVVERADGSLYLLLRTESGYLWEATSRDGLQWTGLKQTTIPSVTCCPQMARLSDGRIALLWNAPPRHNPTNRTSRAELSLAFSTDEAATWSAPVVVAASYSAGARVSYPYLYERSPGELWITTMQGGLRMKIHTADLGAEGIPIHQPPPKVAPKPGGIVMFGDSTTAPRGALQVYAQRVAAALESIGSTLTVHNAGVPSHTTADALKRLQSDVLAHQPRIVVMQFGINDASVDVWKNPPATQPRVPLQTYLANYRTMIAATRKAGARVILMTTNPLHWTAKLREMYGKPPYRPDDEEGFESPHLARYNEALRALARELDVPLVDVRAAYPRFAAEHGTTIDAMLLDGMHPGAAGHELVAELLVPAIRSVLQRPEPAFAVQLDTVSTGFDKMSCWVHPRAGAIPGNPPSAVLTMQKARLVGSDIFYALNEMRTDDFGKTWSGPIEHAATLGRRDEAGGVVVAVSDFWPKWHAKSGKLLGIGHNVRYADDKVIAAPKRSRQTVFSIYDPAQRTWTAWEPLAMPDDPRFFNSGAGCVQRLDLPDGDILLPIYFSPQGGKFSRVLVLRCGFDGRKLTVKEMGNELSVDTDRGLHEPSLTKFQGRYYLTIRHDRRAYVTTSDDGLHFDPQLKPWTWDDGTDLGSYNTQAHWVTHDDALYLCYTRRGANNDHIPRNRAPLFIGQVDPAKLHVIRASERELMPQRGAKLGNFGVTEVNEHETWVTDAEWMQTTGPNYADFTQCMKYGSDNAVFAARIRWKKPNTSWDTR